MNHTDEPSHGVPSEFVLLELHGSIGRKANIYLTNRVSAIRLALGLRKVLCLDNFFRILDLFEAMSIFIMRLYGG